MDENTTPATPPAALDSQHNSLDSLQSLGRALLRLTEIQPIEQVVEIVLDSAYALVPQAQYVRLFLLAGERLKLAAARWADARQPVPGIDSPPEAFAYQVVKEARLCVRKNRSSNGLSGGVIGFPCNLDEHTVGALLVSVPSLDAISPERSEALQILAHQAARAVDTSRRFYRLSLQAYTDALTGLPNRRALDDHLEEEVRRSSRYRHTFTVIMIDLNSFKAINDNLGHPAGDRALQLLASCFRRTLRDTDFVARYGGDEFVVILPETTTDVAQGIAQRLREAADNCLLELTNLTAGGSFISFGMASYPEQAISSNGLITAADQALYQSKQSYHHTTR